MTPAVVLILQGLLQGLVLAFVVIPGSAVFLAAFGAERLPYVYLMVALAGACASLLLTRWQQRIDIFRLAVASSLLMAAMFVVCWTQSIRGFDIAAAAMMVAFSVQLQLGFVFIGTQAGRVFDVQKIKAVFPRIVAGFVGGFMLGGLVAGLIGEQLSKPVTLWLFAAVALVLKAGLMLRLSKRAPPPPAPTAEHSGKPERAGLSALLANPLVRAVFLYQVLSSMGTQLLEYLLFDRAASHFSGAGELTRFMGGYTFALNLTDLLVLLLLGSFMMSRFGLRFGLTANPAIVSALVACAVVVAITAGTQSLMFFALIAIARISDLTMADLATRTSVNASFKAMPAHLRVAAQVNVEGAGVPLAIGITALLILAVNAISTDPLIVVLLVTLLICIAWMVSARYVFNQYGSAVVAAARQRSLDSDIDVMHETSTREAIYLWFMSGNEQDIKTAALVTRGESDTVVNKLRNLAANHDDPEVGLSLLPELAESNGAQAATVIEHALASKTKHLQVAAMEQLREPSVFKHCPEVARLHMPALAHSADKQVAGMALGFCLAKGYSVDESLRNVVKLSRSADPECRLRAAWAFHVIGSTGRERSYLSLLEDSDVAVRTAATTAVAAFCITEKVALLRSDMQTHTRRVLLRALRYSSEPEVVAVASQQLISNQAPMSELIRLLVAADWQVPVSAFDDVDAVLQRRVDTIDRASKLISSCAVMVSDKVKPPAGITAWLAGMVQERNLAAYELLDLLSLYYDRRHLQRLRWILSGQLAGDRAMAGESLDMVLLKRHRPWVTHALQQAICDNADRPVESTPLPVPLMQVSGGSRDVERLPVRQDFPGERNLDRPVAVLETFINDSHWVRHRDWLHACALLSLKQLKPSLQPAGFTSAGPASRQLIQAWQAETKRSAAPMTQPDLSL